MPTYTTRNTLVKPGYADAADIADINTNMDTIDASFAKCNWAAAVAPTVNEDTGDGYVIGSLWFDTTAHKLYVAEVVTLGAAVWRQIYPGGVSAVSAAADPTANDDSGDGYVVGQTWINTSTKQVFVATDVTLTAAVWRKMIAADGTVPLTANWDVGAFKITANQLESDVATGTAPLVIASTTAVTNLNADKVDGRDESEFALLAGRAGNQTLYGGTAASESLVLRSTSHATKGSVTVPDANLAVGTAQTTATAYGIGIHEGAAGASNKIVFLDGDGTTEAAAVYKSGSSDSLVIKGGSYTASLSSSDGVLTCNGGLAISKVATDSNGAYGVSSTIRPTITSSAAITNYNLYTATFPEVRTGVTSSGNIYDFYTETMRNHNGAATDDDGTHSGAIYAMQGFFGHYSSNASMAGTTTYVDGLRLVPYYQKGTISNMFCIEIATGGTGGTVTNNWGIYQSHAGNNYFNAANTRFHTTTGDAVIYVAAGTANDPIADAWRTHSNEKYKNDLGPIDSDIDWSARYQARKAIADKTMHVWTRKADIGDPAHYEAMFPLEDDRVRGTPSKPIPPKPLEVRQAEQDYAIWKHIETCKTLKKFNKVNYGMFAEDTPEEITAYDANGNPEGIDLAAYIGWVHRAVDAMHYDIDSLEVTVADMDFLLWEQDAINYELTEANAELELRVQTLESKNDALLAKHEDYERRMALLEQRLAKLETP
jgi:hypothetical protein